MTAERWNRVKELLHQAMQLAPDQRTEFLDKACSSDDSLRAEVDSLLLAEEDVGSNFMRSAPHRGSHAGPDSGLPTPSLPAKFGPYEIVGPIGKGGMGEVYRARDSRLGRFVAVKILPADMCRDPLRHSRFEHEARAASALNHPNIVSVHDIGSESGIPYIVTELIEGESLRRLIAKGPVPAGELLAIATQLTAGLTAAHAAGVVHRDLKPDNIMLTPDMRVKILDFGLAKLNPQHLDKQRDETQTMTTPGLVMGTIGYLSPEQVRGEAADERSDIFSLGAVLYELASGKRAFAGGKAIDVLSAILREPPAELRVDIPPALDRIIRRCLEKDVQRRFQSASSLAAALKGIGEISRVRRVFWAIERNRRVWWGVAAMLVVVGSFWFAPRWLNRRSLAPPAAEDTNRAPQVAVPAAGPGATVAIERKENAPAAATPEPGKTDAAASQPPNAGPTASVPEALNASPPSPAPEPAKTGPATAASESTKTDPIAAPDVPKSGPANAAPEARNTTPPAPTPEPRNTNPPAASRPAVIETLAGRPWKFIGEGLPARQVMLARCDDIKCDRAGNIYATDWGNHVIVKIDRNGILHVLAGPESSPGDRPHDPHCLAVDNSGAIYFGQIFVIRKLLTNGHVVPVAGNTAPGFTPDGAPAAGSAIGEVGGIALAADGSLIFSEFRNQRVRRVDSQGRLQTIAGNGLHGFAGDGGPAQRASLAGPRGLALDHAGNLFIADPPNACVRKVGLDGRITTVAGRGIAGNLVCPSGVAVSQQGELFIADPCRRQVLVVRNGQILRVGGVGVDHEEPSGDGGPADRASFDEWSLAFDEQDNLLISGPFFGHIYRISHQAKFSIIAGSGFWGVNRDGTPASQAVFQEPFHVSVDGAGNIFMTDLEANRIYRLDRKGIVTQVAGYAQPGYEGNDTPARNYPLNGPHGIRAGPHGNVVFADRDNNRVREVTAGGRLRNLAGNGKRADSGDGGRAVEASLNNPSGVCIDSAGNIYIADTDNHRVRKITPDGRIFTVAGIGLAGYSGDGGAGERAALNTPMAVEVDSNGDLYIADMGNHRIRRISAGVITTLAGDGHPGYTGDGGPAGNARLNLPGDLALGPDRQLYILDRPIRRIRRIDLASGIITTFAGNGENTASGEGGPAIKAGLGRPGGIAADAAGNVYVTDLESKQLRIIRPESH